ncbi:SocA family protein [Duganella dendranthematis]|uniref:SocA family protein n=1 Tax=Duganella dendranthematis TaxID=2728021 RepID=A0ABX6M742_9BURK|nr:SocA family protein [Duganella dendranthematis]
MLRNHDREKLLNVIIFFATNTRNLGKVKLWKLLYFLDFQHYRDVGRPVTGLQYFAWPKGPVPVELQNEVSKPADDMKEKLDLQLHEFEKGVAMTVTPKVDFDASLFSKRELRLLENLAKEFCDSSADNMIEATHFENQPWDKIFNVQGQKQAMIPYELASRAAEAEQIQQLQLEHDEMRNNFSNV